MCAVNFKDMSLITEKHLQDVTVDNMMECQKESFALYASTRGVKLGFNGYGKFIVKAAGKDYTFNNPAIAIDKYAELVRG